MATPIYMLNDKHYYNNDKPVELPAGFMEIIQPFAAWIMKELVNAYDNGYSNGRLDAARIEVMKIERKHGYDRTAES